MLFEISVPEGSTPVTARPHRINIILAGRDPQPIPRGSTDPALDFSIFESAGGHPKKAGGA